MRAFRLAGTFLAAFAALTLVAACSQKPAAKADGMVLHRGNNSEPDTLDTQKASTIYENNIISDMFEGLMTMDASAHPIYGAAISHTVSADGLVWTFKLRDNVQWSDGVPVTADDFVFSFQRILDPKTAAQYASLVYPIKNAQAVNEGKLPPDRVGVKALDPKTVEITLEHPTPYLLTLLTHQTCQVVPKHTIEKLGDQWVKAGNMVSDGPYMLAEWIPNTHVKLVKNSHFYDADKVQIDTIYYFPINDSSIELKRYRAGEFDMTDDAPAREIPQLKKEFGAELKMHSWESNRYIQINVRKKPFGDVRVRQALALAVDREMIANDIYGAGQTPAYSFVPPGVGGYKGGAELKFKSLSMVARRAQARDLLEQAGFGASHPLHFTYRYNESIDNRRQAIAVQDMWKQIGVEVELLNSDTRVHYNALRTQDFEVSAAAWTADYDDAEDFLFLMEGNSGQMNYSKYVNPKYDGLLHQAANTLDLDQRSELLRQAEQVMLDDLPIIPVINDAYRRLARPYVKGYEDNLLKWHRARFMRIERQG
jgi:oligopeptide transport system substrate-binding protein